MSQFGGSGGSFGPNAWLVDDMYDRFLADPNSVSESWREFFADYRPAPVPSPPLQTPPAPATPATTQPGAAAPAPSSAVAPAAVPTPAVAPAAAPTPAPASKTRAEEATVLR